MNIFADAGDAFRIVEVVTCLGGCISTLEFIALRKELSTGGLWDWGVLELQGRWLIATRRGRLISRIFSNNNLIVVLGFQLVAFIAMLARPEPSFAKLFLGGLVTTTWLLFAVRTPFGADGTDQMFFSLLVGITMRHLGPSSDRLAVAALWFIALQSSLAYMTAGVAKLRGTSWRKGSALPAILATDGYGCPPIARALHQRPILAKLLTWSVMTFECAFSAWLIFGIVAAVAVTSVGIAFHAANAFVMGLNRFAFAFAASYPAICYCATYCSWYC